MRPAFRILILCLALFAHYVLAADSARNLSVSAADAPANDRRIALVIGNSAYKSSPLANPVNDARAIGAKLRALGFTVIERENLKFKDIGATLREFRSKLVPGGVALFFYAGHGIQVQGVNYLPVVDADIASEEDVSLQSLEVGKVLSLMDDAKTRLNLVFLDACRNNPFARSFRSAADGLARVSAPTGTLISFATRPGSVAADGTGRNGLYTEQLLTAMDLRGQPIELALKRVVSGVKAASKGRQEPWMEGSIEGDFCFGGCLASGIAAPAAPAAPSAADASANERTFWESVKDSRNPDELNAYLAQYPDGLFASLAKSRLRVLADAPQLASAAPVLHAQSNSAPRAKQDAEQLLRRMAARGDEYHESFGIARPDFSGSDTIFPISDVRFENGAVVLVLEKGNIFDSEVPPPIRVPYASLGNSEVVERTYIRKWIGIKIAPDAVIWHKPRGDQKAMLQRAQAIASAMQSLQDVASTAMQSSRPITETDAAISSEPAAKATVYVMRKRGFLPSGHTISVKDGDVEIGTVADGTFFTYQINAGDRTLTAYPDIQGGWSARAAKAMRFAAGKAYYVLVDAKWGPKWTIELVDEGDGKDILSQLSPYDSGQDKQAAAPGK